MSPFTRCHRMSPPVSLSTPERAHLESRGIPLERAYRFDGYNLHYCNFFKAQVNPLWIDLPSRHKKNRRGAIGFSSDVPAVNQKRALPTLSAFGQYHRREELNYRVRNGNGCCLFTVGTRNSKLDSHLGRLPSLP